jgi:uncharacterized protein involved in oxidation of intracellular sulfur
MKVLVVINDAPYGNERAYNALRLAMALQKEHAADVRVFLMADAVTCALPDQRTPDGYYNIGRMAKAIIQRGGQVKACGTCADARGLREHQLIEDVEISNMSQLAHWAAEADKIITF